MTMGIDNIEEVVSEFLDSDEPNALVLRGDWGVGKTYFWKERIKKYEKDKCSKKWNHVYVSLFGINSLDDFKRQITYGFYEALTNGFFKKLPKYVMQSFEIPPIKGFKINSDYIGWSAVKDILVCVDDLERHGKDLNPKDIFGLISDLKDQKHCKIALILNDKNLNKGDKKAYNIYREKVVDVEIQFSRTPSELINFVFGSDKENSQSLINCNDILYITNIRTLFKIRCFLKKLYSRVDSDSECLRNKITRCIFLYTALHFSKPDPIKENGETIEWPDLDLVLETNFDKALSIKHAIEEFGKNKPKADGDYKALKGLEILMDCCEWYGSDSLDKVLGDFVKRGYLLDDKAFDDACEEYINFSNNEKEINKVQKLTSKVRDLLWRNFDDNVDDIYAAMEEAISSRMGLGPSSLSNSNGPVKMLNQYVSVLRGIKECEKANDLISNYIKAAKNKNSDYLKTDGLILLSPDSLDKKLEDMVGSAFNDLRQQEDKNLLSEIDKNSELRKIADRCPSRNLKEEDYRILSYFGYNDFHNFLKNTEIDRSIDELLNIFLAESTIKLRHCEECHGKVKNILSKVVKDISDESDINEWRMRRFLEDK